MGESKQVKVDNWGIFFLQRLQTFFNKTYYCDLTLQFEDNVQLKVHRLVLSACTEYFQVLERTCELVNDCLIMPPDLQADVVVPIVNFMYTGILEFHMSTFDRLYSTARLMNMTVLTKLLDAQKVPISPISKPINKRSPIAPITWNLQGKKIAPKTMDPDLPEPLPGRKLPIWKRKSVPVSNVSTYPTGLLQSISEPLSSKYFRSQPDESPKPTRFEWPDDDNNFDTNPFDEISYTSKPIIISSTTREKSPKPSTSGNSVNFDEIKRSAVKRPASPVYNDVKKVNIQDMKEYIKEQKLRSDYNEYDDSEAADNDLQSFDDTNDSDEDNGTVISDKKSILKNETIPVTPNKKVRFTLEEKENTVTDDKQQAASSTSNDMTNHTKIITEVLKKFPQLVQKNKNIRLKILAKGQNANAGAKATPVGPIAKTSKPISKVSYMLTKPTEIISKTTNQDKKDGQWVCQKCTDPGPLCFDSYHMYRQHLTEVHNEKTDSQMCNICGHVSRKQNMLMYHRYVKHNIEPPPIFQFPKCKECPYIALSPSLLIKHQYNHTHHNLVCSECNVAFTNKTDLIKHVQATGHSGQNTNNNGNATGTQQFNCDYCSKKFISAETLYQHYELHHKDIVLKAKDDSQTDDKDNDIITAEEIDAIHEENKNQISQEPITPDTMKKDKKIKILSNIKVPTNRLLPVNRAVSAISNKIDKIQTEELEAQHSEPSSEAESLSNVASGIAASLGLVNTIVVLDENNQFIIQDDMQNAVNQQNFILSDGTNIENIQNLHVSQHQVITSANNSIITQAQDLNKSNIGSTDELVMVLTDHDYSDAANSTVLTSDNSNIVVLYSHPVQGQDGEFITPQNIMLNSNMGLVSVPNQSVMDDKACEESIEMIQQEINNHLETDISSQLHLPPEQITHESEQMPQQILQEPEPIDNEKPNESIMIVNTVIKDVANLADKMEIETFETKLVTEETEELLVDSIPEGAKELQTVVEINNTVELENVTQQIDKQEIVLQTEIAEPKETISEISFEEPMEVESIEIDSENISDTYQVCKDHDKDINKEDEETEVLCVKEQSNANIEENKLILPEKDQEVITSLENSSAPTEPIFIEQNDQNSLQCNEEDIRESESNESSSKEDINEIKEEIEIKESDIEYMEVDSSKSNLINESNVNEAHILSSSEHTINKNTNELELSEEVPKEIIEESSEKSSDENETFQPDADTIDNIESEKTIELQQCDESSQQNADEEEISSIPLDVSSETTIETETISIQEKDTYSLDENIEYNNDEILSPKISKEDNSEKAEIITEETILIDEENKIDNTKNRNDDVIEISEVCSTSNEHLTSSLNQITNTRISNLLDEWDDGDTDSQQSDTMKHHTVHKIEDNTSSINTLINDWEDED